jgi:hypothetical protein
MLLPPFPSTLNMHKKLLLLTIKKEIEEQQMEQSEDDDEQVKYFRASLSFCGRHDLFSSNAKRYTRKLFAR